MEKIHTHASNDQTYNKMSNTTPTDKQGLAMIKTCYNT